MARAREIDMKLLEISGLLAAVFALCIIAAPPAGAGALSPESEFAQLERGLDKLKADASRVRKERDRASDNLSRVLECVKRDLTRSTGFLKIDARSRDRVRTLIRSRLERATTDLSFTYPADFFPKNPRGGLEVERKGDQVRVVFLSEGELPPTTTATLEDLVEVQGKMLGRMRSDLIRVVEGLRASRTTIQRRDEALRASAERTDRLARENRALKERIAELEAGRPGK